MSQLRHDVKHRLLLGSMASRKIAYNLVLPVRDRYRFATFDVHMTDNTDTVALGSEGAALSQAR